MIGRWVSDVRTGLSVAVVSCAVYLAAGVAAGDDVMRVGGNLAMTVAPLLAGAMMLLVSRGAGREGRPWRFLGAAALAWATGQALFTGYQLGSAELPFPGPPDAFFLLTVPLLLTGAAVYRHSGHSAARWRNALDGGVVVLAVAVAVWFLVLGPLARSGDQDAFGRLVGLAYPIADVAALAFALIALARVRRARRPVVPLAGAMLTLAVGDSAFSLGTLSDSYVTGQWSDIGWVGGWLLLWPAAAAARAAAADDAEDRRSLPALLVPYAAVAIASSVALVEVIGGHHIDVVDAALVFAMVVSLLVRQGVFAVDQYELTRALAAREEHFRSLVQGSSDVVSILDEHLLVQYQSPSVRRVFGLQPDAAAGRHVLDLVHRDDRRTVAAAFAALLDGAPGGETRIACRLRDGEGRWRDTEATVNDHRHTPSVAGIVVHTRDVSDRRGLERELERLAFHDFLTGAANRALLSARLEEAITAGRVGAAPPGAIVLDLDGFKSVNDLYGHDTGDALLIEVARRLRGAVRGGDTVARLGGDEFAVVVDGRDGELDRTAERLLGTLCAPYAISGRVLDVSASLGVAAAEPDDDAESLLRKADLALRRAKADGKRRVESYREGMTEAVLDRALLEADLRTALETGEGLGLAYQPILTLPGREIVGMESLLRWQHPTRGAVSPVEVIAVAEETGLVVDLGRWVVRTACRQLGTWLDAGFDLRLGVNVSVRELQRDGFVEHVERSLHEHGVPPEHLVLEITETVVVGEEDAAVANLERLHAMGVRLAVDDFGTGYSSLSYLRRLPVDILKIDRSFTSDVGSGSDRHVLSEAVVALGDRLGLDVVAEGIETEEQAAALVAMGCPLGQGYLFARPLPAADIGVLLAGSGRIRPVLASAG